MTARNDTLAAYQDRLHGLGLYPSSGDGQWGPATEKALDAVISLVERARGFTPSPFPKLPAAYQWIAGLSGLPLTIHEGLKLLGTVEVAGNGNSPTIMGWRDELNGAGWPIVGFSGDAVPWCGLFAAVVAHRARKPVVASPLWADNWRKWGISVVAADASLGDLVTYSRPGGNHVAFLIGEDAAGYDHVLGGNQSDAVNIMRIARSRRTSVRRPAYANRPAAALPRKVAATGLVSVNES